MKGKQVAVTILVGMTAFAAGFLLRTTWEDSTFDNVQTGSNTNQAAQGSPSSSQEYVITQDPDNSSVDSSKTETAITADMIQVRIDDGEVQWFDGTLWHTVASVEELSGEDKFYLALEPFLAFSQELQQEKAEAQTESWQAGTFMAEENGLSVGQKATPKPTPKPNATPKPSSETMPPAQDPADAAPNTPAQSAPASGAPAPSTPAPDAPAPSTPAPDAPAPSTPAPDAPAPSTPAPSTPTPNIPAPSTPAPDTPTPDTPAPSTLTPSTPAPSTPAPSEPDSGDGEDIDWTFDVL